MDLSEVMRTTPATREFTSDPVPDEVLERIIDTARFAPSGGNRQPWRLVVVRDAGLRAEIREAYRIGWREYWAHVEQGLIPFAPREENLWPGPAVDLKKARQVERPDPFGDHLDEVPVLLILLAHLPSLAVTDNGLGRQSIVGGASVYPFAHNLLLAARNEGLGAVMTTVICRQEPRVKDLLAVPTAYAVAGLIAMGRPRRQVRNLRRLAVAELAFVDRFGGAPFGSEG